jgi:hypothetical protein
MDFDKNNPTGNIWNIPIVCSKPVKTIKSNSKLYIVAK